MLNFQLFLRVILKIIPAMEPTPGDIETSNFRYQHHSFRCKADSQDPFITASYKRKSLAQWYHASLSLCDIEGTCQVLENKTLSYQNLVDDRAAKSINNYAGASLTVASAAGKNDTTKWKTGLRTNKSVLSIVKKLTECPGKCSKLQVTDQDLKRLADIDEQKETNQKTQGKSGFVPKRPGPSQLFGSHGGFNIQKLESSSKLSNNLTRGNSFETALGAAATCSTTKWDRQQQQPSAPLNDRNYLSDSNSNSFDRNNGEMGGSGGTSMFGMRTAITAGNTSQKPSTFRIKGTNGFKGNNVESVWDGTNGDSSAGSRNYFPENTAQRRGGIQGDSNFPRGANYSSNVSGPSRNSQSGYQSINNQNQRTQSEAGMSSVSASIFRTARDELVIQNQKKYGSRGGNNGSYQGRGSVAKRSLGTARRAGVHGKFVPPIKPTDEDDFGGMFGVKQPGMEVEGEEEMDERLKNIDPKMVETIRNEIMDIGAPVEWDDIAGLDFAKTTIQEIVVWPLLRPDIFTGLRKPPKGLLLFGPPGTGKTLIGKCIASQSQSTFFSISASSLTSKWIGDGEKMVRALFAVAKVHQPSVVFIDEIDSLLTQRSDTEHESSRRIKTEFLVQLDGAGTGDEERILVVGATNRPQELDEAARRRLVKRLYIPLPEFEARKQIVERLMSSERSALTTDEVNEIASLTDGYSGADMKTLCQEASLGPIRSISFSAMHQITPDQVRPINVDDFKTALQRVRASVSSKDLDAYVQWDKTYGMGSGL